MDDFQSFPDGHLSISRTVSDLKSDEDGSGSINGPQISAGLDGFNDLFENQKSFIGGYYRICKTNYGSRTQNLAKQMVCIGNL